ncbi:type II toxin-antitoxin system prevent-host-death family antitoxin [Streptomyces sp. NPDC007346]|uniref:type II toxin-antitoxin system Phd/YefM family antitoxin n=1 Tax=Streptomyces sp. NPDC007346 TaxID=3154682 RepID=UPI003454FEAD
MDLSRVRRGGGRSVARTLSAVVDDREEVVVTRAGHEPVVIVALDEYESLKETAYLLRSPENARRLPASIERLEGGGGAEQLDRAGRGDAQGIDVAVPGAGGGLGEYANW